ncbi:hypothetical protein HK105_207635 [Polyrhizophydium stewartii]|uniref:SH3 domain-containing protein n=1 Tax=Polyrhizophydium stewartii TaxID=2732419 RepID=A0ABR4N046_9FUNG
MQDPPADARDEIPPLTSTGGGIIAPPPTILPQITTTTNALPVRLPDQQTSLRPSPTPFGPSNGTLSEQESTSSGTSVRIAAGIAGAIAFGAIFFFVLKLLLTSRRNRTTLADDIDLTDVFRRGGPNSTAIGTGGGGGVGGGGGPPGATRLPDGPGSADSPASHRMRIGARYSDMLLRRMSTQIPVEPAARVALPMAAVSNPAPAPAPAPSKQPMGVPEVEPPFYTPPGAFGAPLYQEQLAQQQQQQQAAPYGFYPYDPAVYQYQAQPFGFQPGPGPYGYDPTFAQPPAVVTSVAAPTTQPPAAVVAASDAIASVSIPPEVPRSETKPKRPAAGVPRATADPQASKPMTLVLRDEPQQQKATRQEHQQQYQQTDLKRSDTNASAADASLAANRTAATIARDDTSARDRINQVMMRHASLFSTQGADYYLSRSGTTRDLSSGVRAEDSIVYEEPMASFVSTRMPRGGGADASHMSTATGLSRFIETYGEGAADPAAGDPAEGQRGGGEDSPAELTVLLMQAISQYAPVMNDELALEKSDRVNVHRVFPDGWGYAENLSTGMRGMCPLNFLIPRQAT